MDIGVISAAFGALTQERRFEVIANNLANASTAGYKRDRISFADLLHAPTAGAKSPASKPSLTSASASTPTITPVGFGPNWDASRVRVTDLAPDLTQGGLEETGNPLDLAIEGSGFFKLQTPQGVLYSRRGSLAVAKDGTLVSQEGYPVLGEKGKKIKVGEGQVIIGSDGTVSAAGVEVGRIGLAQFPEGTKLAKVGESLFAASGDPGPAKLPYTVRQGALELSNVNPVQEMVAMIDALRQYEAYQKVLQSYGQIDARSSEIAQLR
jgi:flagellar basal-body rod protein FlgG